MAGSKKTSQARSATTTKKRSASAKAVRSRTAASPSRQRRPQARSASHNQARPKTARGRAWPRRNAAAMRGSGEIDVSLMTQLETITEGLAQIAEVRTEVEHLRAVIEKLVRTVSALTPDSPAEARAPEDAVPATTEGVLIIETYGVSAAENEQPELQGAA